MWSERCSVVTCVSMTGRGRQLTTVRVMVDDLTVLSNTSAVASCSMCGHLMHPCMERTKVPNIFDYLVLTKLIHVIHKVSVLVVWCLLRITALWAARLDS